MKKQELLSRIESYIEQLKAIIPKAQRVYEQAVKAAGGTEHSTHTTVGITSLIPDINSSIRTLKGKKTRIAGMEEERVAALDFSSLLDSAAGWVAAFTQSCENFRAHIYDI